MRGIAAGQTLTIFLTPEVVKLMAEVHQACGHGDWKAKLESLHAEARQKTGQSGQLLRDVAAWLVINSMRSEKLQFNLLSEQSLSNVWRKPAYRHLMTDEARARVGTNEIIKHDRVCLDVFRQRLAYGVENTVPTSKPFFEKLREMVDAHQELIVGDHERATVDYLLQLVHGTEGGAVQTEATRVDTDRNIRGSEAAAAFETAVEDMGTPAEVAKERQFNAEQVQEQEQEQVRLSSKARVKRHCQHVHRSKSKNRNKSKSRNWRLKRCRASMRRSDMRGTTTHRRSGPLRSWVESESLLALDMAR